MPQKTVNFLIPDRHWPMLLARASHKGVEALQRAGVDYGSIETQLSRVVDLPTGDGPMTGWSVVLTGTP